MPIRRKYKKSTKKLGRSMAYDSTPNRLSWGGRLLHPAGMYFRTALHNDPRIIRSMAFAKYPPTNYQTPAQYPSITPGKYGTNPQRDPNAQIATIPSREIALINYPKSGLNDVMTPNVGYSHTPMFTHDDFARGKVTGSGFRRGHYRKIRVGRGFRRIRVRPHVVKRKM